MRGASDIIFHLGRDKPLFTCRDDADAFALAARRWIVIFRFLRAIVKKRDLEINEVMSIVMMTPPTPRFQAGQGKASATPKN